MLRWDVRFSAYTYTLVHIKGVNNVWADILSPWSAAAVIRRLVKVSVLPSSSAPQFEWPYPDEISRVQKKFANDQPAHLVLHDLLCKNPAGAVWIPDNSSGLQLRMCIISHTGPMAIAGQFQQNLLC